MSNRSKQCLAEQTVLCPHTRPDKAVHHADAFAYDKRSQSARRLAGRLDKSAAFAPKGRGIDGAMPSQLIGALLGEDAYAYSYDNIGNREIAQEAAEDITYDANDLNQYTRISTNGEDFTPEYDADGNQTLIQTSTGIWHVTYNGQNRAIKFESKDGHTVITCGYDYLGRRFEKKVTVDGAVTLHERYIYRGYLQIAALDMLHGASLIHAITWDPTQEVATRPLAIRENGVWYTYGWDLTKNICELYDQEGFIRTIYTYSPYGQVRENESTTQSPRGIGGGLDNAEALPEGRTGNGVPLSQPIQWSSEMYDAKLGLVYYNFRYYNPRDGRWTRRDPAGVYGNKSLYSYVLNQVVMRLDELGLNCDKCNEYIAKKMQTYAVTIAKIRKKCKLDITCGDAEGDDGYEVRTDRWWNFSIHILILIDCCVGATEEQDSPEDTFGHELVHAIDDCFKRDSGSSCKDSVCREMRAYTIGGCKWKTGHDLKECLKERVPASSSVYCNEDQVLMENLIEENYERCLQGYPH